MNQDTSALLSDGGFSKLDYVSSLGTESLEKFATRKDVAPSISDAGSSLGFKVENFTTEKDVAHRTQIALTDTRSLFEKKRGDNVSSLNRMSRAPS